MLLLSGIMETYSWTQFKPILYSPDRLEAWVRDKMPKEPVSASVEEETRALEFLGELNNEERAKIETAFRRVWGPKGAASLPISLR